MKIDSVHFFALTPASRLGRWPGFLACGLLPCLAAAVGAGERTPGGDDSSIRIKRSADRSGSIEIEVRRASLADALDAIARETGVAVRHADLPGDLLTTSCGNAAIEQVVECLVGPDANLVYRYPEDAAKSGGTSRPEQIWVTGKVAKPGEAAAGGVPPSGKDSPPANGRTEAPPASPQQTRKALEMAAAADAEKRLEGLSMLAARGAEDDEAVRRTLETALADEDPSARAQAVYGLARLGGAAAAGMLQDALHDSDVDVRVMAVDSAGADPQGTALLQQALRDPDETVREFAAMRLQEHAGESADR